MIYLCLGRNFSGQLGDIAAALAKDSRNTVAVASQSHDSGVPGARRILIKKTQPLRGEKNFQSYWLEAGKRAGNARGSFETALKNGFEPDIILAESANGAGLMLRAVFPRAFIACYAAAERPQRPGSREEVAALIENMQFMDANICFARSQADRRRFPALLASALRVAPLFVDTDFFTPGQHVPGLVCAVPGPLAEGPLALFARLLQGLLGEGKSLVVRAENPRQKELLLAMTADCPGRERLCVETWFEPAAWRDVCSGAELMLWPSPRPDRQFLSALACGALIMCGGEADQHRTPGITMPWPRGTLQEQAKAISAALAGAQGHAATRAAARAHALAEHSRQKLLPRHLAFLERAYAQSRA